MVTLPLRPVLSRLWTPMIELSFVALLAVLCVNYPRAYHEAMTAIMTNPWSRPFIDWEAVTGWIECWSKGVDVYIDNIPCLPLPNNGFNYSPLLLRLTFIRFAYGWTNLLGFSFAVLFFLSLSLLPPSRTKLDFVITLLASIFSATAHAVERANTDLIVFLAIVIGVLACGSRLLVRRSRVYRYYAGGSVEVLSFFCANFGRPRTSGRFCNGGCRRNDGARRSGAFLWPRVSAGG